MKLPQLASAVVPAAKITDYLLSATHRDGRHKAAFFARFGFTVEDGETLAAALLQHADEHEIANIEASPFGARYVIEGELHAPDGRAPQVRVVWFIAAGETAPALVTAYPLIQKRV